jgi:NADH-quinone oxidoreductase subunit M
MFSMPVLTILIILPIISSLIVLMVNGKSNYVHQNIRYITILTSVIYLIIAGYLYISLDKISSNLQFIDKINILPIINFSYYVALDGISLILLLLVGFVFFITFTFINFPEDNIKIYAISFLIMLSGATGLFVSQDLLMFFIFYEYSIIPLFIIISLFGSKKTLYIPMKFILYSIFGSIIMLSSFIYIIYITKSASIEDIIVFKYSNTQQFFLFWGLFLSFIIKSGLFPFNTWIAETYEEAPISANIVLSSIFIKYGIFGIIKILLPAFSVIIALNLDYIYYITLFSIFYGVIIALKSNNIKRLFAYLSISHIALIIASAFSANIYAIDGVILQIVSHSLYNISFFIIIYYLYNTFNSLYVKDIKNLYSLMPKLSFFIVLFGLCSIGFPLTASFIAEILMFYGILVENKLLSLFFIVSIIFSTAVIFVLFKNILLGDHTLENNNLVIRDINFKQILVLSILLILLIVIGINPSLILDTINITVNGLIEHLKVSKVIL